jgi:hypothetical protein
VVFDKATGMSYWTSSQFLFFVLMVTSVEDPNSQKYITNGMKASVAHFTRQGYASLKEHQNNTRFF